MVKNHDLLKDLALHRAHSPCCPAYAFSVSPELVISHTSSSTRRRPPFRPHFSLIDALLATGLRRRGAVRKSAAAAHLVTIFASIPASLW